MFSATGKILSGTQASPDLFTLLDPSTDFKENDTQVSKWNGMGYMPGVSTISGCTRFLLGIIHSIIHLVMAVFDKKNRAHHLAQAKLGAHNIVRGYAEVIPILGNIGVMIHDGIRIRKQMEVVDEYKKSNPQVCHNHILLFANNKFVDKKSTDAMNRLAINAKFTRRPTYWETIRLILGN